MGDFYGTEIKIWAGFGPVGITEKKKRFRTIMSNILGRFFQVFMRKKQKTKKSKNNVASALKSCIKKFNFFFFLKRLKKIKNFIG